MLTDTHCHLDFEKFHSDRHEILRRAWSSGVIRILIPGLDIKSSRQVIQLAESDPRLFAAIGVHPNDSLTWDGQTIEALKELSISQKIVAIGEIGLDYYWDEAPRDHQEKVLSEQLSLAAELELPVVIHMREKGDRTEGECSRDLIRILSNWVGSLKEGNNPITERPGVLHSFSGTPDIAEQAMDLGFFIGVTGPVTYMSGSDRQSMVRQVPLERILIETDAPFLSPVPKRGQRNEPANVSFIADKIAEIHSVTSEKVAEITTLNAARLFGWGD